MQVLSIIASLITMAFVTGNYQRFESQHIVGRPYPWSSAREIAWQRRCLERTTVPPLFGTVSGIANRTYTEVPASEHVIQRFAESTAAAERSTPSALHTKSLHLGEYNLDRKSQETDAISSDDDNDNIKMQSFLRQQSIESNMDTVDMLDMDETPRIPAPPLPPPLPPLQLGLATVGAVMNRMSTITEMMLFKSELYLRDHVPRIPENFHLNSSSSTQHTKTPAAPDTSVETTDQPLQLPTRRAFRDGLEQDDFLGKSVSFAGWSFVLLQRMLALSAFAYFHPVACLILCASHYALMLIALLLLEARLREKPERLAFYVFLAYVYVFCIVEFKVKFRRPRRTLLAYAVLVMLQNVSISLWWFGQREAGRLADAVAAGDGEAAAATVSSAWWFGFMFAGVLLSGTYAMMCWVVYWYLLRPSQRILFEAAEARAVAAEAATATPPERRTTTTPGQVLESLA